MKNTKQTMYLMTRRYTRQYLVLAKGFTPFETDSLNEAVLDAEIKAACSTHVSLLDDGEIIAKWLGHQRVQVVG